MANHKSALKRIRSTEKRRKLNKYYLKTSRNIVKTLRATENKTEAADQLKKTTSLLDKLAKKNRIHKNKAANLKSKLTRMVNGL